MEELSGAPSSMKPFFDVLKKVYVDMEDPFEGMEIPTVGTFCVMAPQELIYAAGAQPVKLCSGSYTAFAIGDDIVPRDACPLVKAVEGFREIGVMPVYRNASMMVVPMARAVTMEERVVVSWLPMATPETWKASPNCPTIRRSTAP